MPISRVPCGTRRKCPVGLSKTFSVTWAVDDAGDRLRLRHTLLLDQQFQRAVAASASGHLEHTGLLAIGIDDGTNAQAL
jgi:hypothetical protein